MFDSYNAFTDLTYWNGYYWLVFRTGEGHVSPNGKIVVYRSTDAENWDEIQKISQNGLDLRDPRVVIMDNCVFILCFSLRYGVPGKSTRFVPHDSFLFKWNGEEFTEHHVFDYDRFSMILWDMAKIRDKYYIGGYGFELGHREFSLMRSDSIKGRYRRVTSLASVPLPPNLGINEVDFVRENGDLLYLLCRIDRDSKNRVDRKNRKAARRAYRRRKKANKIKPAKRRHNYFGIAKAKHPFEQWNTDLIRKYVKGPRGILYNGKLLVCARYKEKRQTRRSVMLFEYWKNDLKPLLTLGTGNDGSYAGLTLNPSNHDELIISFYSDHARVGTSKQGKFNDIWIARVRLSEDH